MAEDFQVRQGTNTQSGSSGYALGGAALGALGGGLGAHYLTKPKYGSYEQIIAEAKDSTDFSSKIEKAEGEEKTFLEAAKEMAGKEKTAGDKWDAEFKEYQDTHKETLVETDQFKEKVKKVEEKENAINTKKAELEKFEIPAEGNTPARKYTETEIKELLAADNAELDELKNAVEEAKKGLEKGEPKTAEQLLEDFAKEKGVKDKAEYIGKEVETSKKKFIEDSKQWIERKYGFAEHTNLKIAGAAVAGALLIGGLASLLSPKKD